MAVTSFAAIVINTSGIAMRIYEMNKKNGIKQIDELVHNMQCGQEIYKEGRLSFDSAEEICAVVKDFQKKLLEYAVVNLQLYISHSLTEAFNLDFLVTQIRIKTGLKAKVLNGSKEHYLTLQSIAGKMSNFNELIQKGTLILDIGYGNLQVTQYDHSELLGAQRYRLGVSRIREMMSRLDMKNSDYPRLIEEAIISDLREFKRHILKDQRIENVIVIGGEMGVLNRQENVNVYQREELMALRKELMATNLDTAKMHTKLLLPLLVIIDSFMEMTEATCVYAPDVHLCDGIVSDFAYKKLKIFSGHHFTEDRISAAIHLAKRFDCDMEHNLYVRNIANELFKTVSKPYGLNNKDQQVLELASILYDCGRYINHHNDDDLTYEIIKESEFINLSDLNRLLVANVLRYKDKPFPHVHELNEPLVSADFYVILARVTALFRLAEALDTCHLQKLEDVHATIKNKEFIVRATTRQEVNLETYAFNESSGLFQEVFGLKPILKCKRRI